MIDLFSRIVDCHAYTSDWMHVTVTTPNNGLSEIRLVSAASYLSNFFDN